MFSLEFLRKWLKGDHRQQQATSTEAQSLVELPEAVAVVDPLPEIGSEVKCFVETVQREPKRFRVITTGSLRIRHSPEVCRLVDRKLGREWKFTFYPKSFYRDESYISVPGLSLTEAEQQYLLVNLLPIFTKRAWRKVALERARRDRQVMSARAELHKLYCDGGVCVTS